MSWQVTWTEVDAVMHHWGQGNVSSVLLAGEAKSRSGALRADDLGRGSCTNGPDDTIQV